MLVVSHVDNGINIDNMLEQIGLDEQNSLLMFAANNAIRRMESYIPRSNGHYDIKTGQHIPGGMLRENVEPPYMEGDKCVIEYTQPYARYQYYGKLMVMDNGKGAYHDPKTGAFWSDKGKKKHLTDIDLHHSIGGPYWDKAMLTAEGEEYIRELQDFVDKRLNNESK